VSVVANVAINVDSRNAVNQLRQVETRAKATEQAFSALQQAVAAFGAGFALSKVIADVKELDTNLRRLGTVGGDVQALDKGLGVLSKQLDGVASKAELAAASYQALSAGFTETGANLKVVEAATKAAVGGLVDVTSVVEVTTKTLNAYGLGGEYAIKVTDSISKAIEYGQVQWSDYTSQLGRVAATAALAGVSIDEVNAFVAAATKNGATAEVAFTGLSAALATLLKPTKESTEAAAALGIEWNVGGLQARGFSGLLEDLSKKQDANKTAVAALLGSQEALRGVLAANSKAGKDYQIILEGLGGATGKTDKDFQTMKDSLDNQLKALDTAFKNLSEALGTAFGPTVVGTIGDVTGAVNAFADAINAIPQPVATAIAEIVKIVAQMILLQKAIQGIVALRAGFVAAMTGMAATTAATGAAATTSSSAFALYTANTKTLQAAAATATPTLVGLRGVLASIASIGTIAVAVNIAVYGLQAVMQARAELDRLRGARSAGGAAAAFGGSAPESAKQAQRKVLQQIEAERRANLPMQAVGQISGFGRGLGNTREQILAERERFARGVLALPTRQAGVGGLPTPTSVAQMPFDEGGGKDKKKKERESQIPALQNELALQNRILEIVEETGLARLAGNKATEAALQIEQILEERSAKISDINLEKIPNAEKELKIKIATAEADRRLVEASFARQNAAQDLRVEQEKQIAEVLSGLDMELVKLQAKTDAEREAIQFLEIENQLKAQGITLTDLDAEAIRRKIAEIQKLTKEQKAAQDQAKFIEQQFAAIGAGIGDLLTNAFDNLINKTKDWNDVLRDSLMAVGRLLMMAGLNMLAGTDGKGVLSFLGFGGGFGTRAAGGPVTGGKPYIVGERGPELFLPSTGGNVMSNNDLRSAMGSSSAAAGAPVLNMSFQTTNIGGVEYVSRDQLEQAMAATRRQAASDGAKRGMTMTLDKLQQSPGTRSRVGLR
jgi:TP901 family phage tail tape measure protein